MTTFCEPKAWRMSNRFPLSKSRVLFEMCTTCALYLCTVCIHISCSMDLQYGCIFIETCKFMCIHVSCTMCVYKYIYIYKFLILLGTVGFLGNSPSWSHPDPLHESTALWGFRQFDKRKTGSLGKSSDDDRQQSKQDTQYRWTCSRTQLQEGIWLRLLFHMATAPLVPILSLTGPQF